MGLFIIVIIVMVIIVLKNKSTILNDFNKSYAFVRNNTNGDHAVSPAMYNQSEDKIAVEIIKEELEQQGFSKCDTSLSYQLRRTLLFVVYGLILFIVGLINMFRISYLLSGYVLVVSTIIFVLMFFKYTYINSLLKQVKNRETEDIGSIIAAYTQQRVNSVPFILARLLCVIVLFVLPYMLFSNPTFFYEKTDGGYAIRYYVGANLPTTIEVPSEHKGEPIVEIRGNVFKDLKDVTEVKLPDTIKTIRGKAFMNDTHLESINLPTSLTYLGGNAFSGCESLKEIEIPEGVKEIGGYTFYNNVSLTNVKINSPLDKIGGHAFEGCISLRLDNVKAKSVGAYAFADSGAISIEYLDGAEEVEAYTFKNTRIKSISIPSSVKKIGEAAFYGTVGISNINLPNGLQEISEEAFKNSDVTNITIPDTVYKLSAHVFEDCRALTSVKLSKNINIIKASTFRNTYIREIVIPEGVTEIGERAFRNCGKLTSVTIPSTLRVIGDSAFRECPMLYSLTIPKGVSIGEKAFKDSPTQITRK